MNRRGFFGACAGLAAAAVFPAPARPEVLHLPKLEIPVYAPWGHVAMVSDNGSGDFTIEFWVDGKLESTERVAPDGMFPVSQDFLK